MKPKSRDQQLNQKVRYRDRIIFGLFLMLAIAIAGLARAPHELDVYQPPDLRYGNLTRADVVPEHAVYAFAETIFDMLMTWPNDGSKDYKNNQETLAAFFTPTFKSWLNEDYNARLHSKPSELAGRVSYISVLPGTRYKKDLIKPLSKNSWIVYLDRQVNEYLGDRLVKTTNVRYPLHVVRWDISRQYNPWRLAIDGFDGEIKRIEVKDDKKSETEVSS